MIRRGWNLLLERFEDRGDAAATRCAHLERALPLCGLALLFATVLLWRLQEQLPRVPWWNIDRLALDWLERIAYVMLLVTLLAAATLPRRPLRRAALALSCFALAALVLGDQHRLQPWAYQYLLWAVVLVAALPERGVALLRLLTVSIYIYSAWSKLDASFAQTLGPQIVEALLKPLGLTTAGWPPAAQAAAALTLPLGELLIGLGLCVPRLRRATVVLACLMHVATIAALSPWGLNHRSGVLIWNAWFIVQDLILFWPLRPSSAGADEPAPGGRWGAVAELVAACALLWPLTEPWGWCDRWPAWGLYATRAQRVTVLVHADDADRLSETFRPFLAPADENLWRPVRLDAWSLAEFEAPLYPQQRFQLALALAIAEQPGLRHPVQVVAADTANRLTGRRDAVTLWGPVEIREYTRRFWFSAEPQWRPASTPAPAREP